MRKENRKTGKNASKAASGGAVKIAAGILAGVVVLGGIAFGVSSFMNRGQTPQTAETTRQELSGRNTAETGTALSEGSQTEAAQPTEAQTGSPIEMVPLVHACREVAQLQNAYLDLDAAADEDAFMANVEALDAYFDEDSKNARVSWYSAPSGINWTWSFPNVYRTAGEQIDVVWLCFEDSTNELLAYTLAVYDMQTGLFSDVEWTMTSVGSSYSYALAGGAGDSTEAQPNEDAMGAKNPASLLPDFAEELDQARADRDDEIAAGFLNTVCTWNSYAEYTAAREQIMADYDLTESSQFMSVFMPEIGNITSSDGTNYNKIDVLGLNMTDQRIKSYVTKIDGGDYSYFTVVDVRSTWENGGESVVQAVLLYTVDAGGSLSDVYAVPVI